MFYTDVRRFYFFLYRFLTYDPSKRVAALDALSDVWFKSSPKPVDPSNFPTWPAKSELVKRDKNEDEKTPKAPSGGYSHVVKASDMNSGGFKIQTAAAYGVSKGGPGFQLKF